MSEQYGQLSREYGLKPEGYYRVERREMLDFVPIESRLILDIGCSAGEFGRLLKERCPETVVWGIEPDVKAARRAESRLDHVINDVFGQDDPRLDGLKFDAICLNDVLEHLANPEDMLRSVRHLLSPKGVVVASIPNILFFYQIVEILWQQDWRYEDAGIMDNTHLRFFTKKKHRQAV